MDLIDRIHLEQSVENLRKLLREYSEDLIFCILKRNETTPLDIDQNEFIDSWLENYKQKKIIEAEGVR